MTERLAGAQVSFVGLSVLMTSKTSDSLRISFDFDWINSTDCTD